MKKYLSALILSASFIIFGTVKFQPLISFDAIVNGLTQPVDIEEVNDSSHRLFIVEQPGQIRIWNGTALSSAPFLNLASKISYDRAERGLLSLAFHPDYISNGYFYVYYTNISGDVTIARYSRSTADLADSNSGVILMTIPKPFANHNGGNLVFGPDGYLYFGTGDGGGAGDTAKNSQNGASLLGKMIRIDVNNPDPPYYRIPADNPFKDSTTTKPEIIAVGLRNPWRWSFDKKTGDMWIADVGQNLWEEVDFVKKDSVLNKNYGWNCFEATHIFDSSCKAQSNNVFPIFEYPHNNATGGISITGGYVYRGSEYPDLQGFYICTDYVSANGWLIKPDSSGGWNTTMQTKWAPGIVSFGETANGTLYALSLGGTLYKVVAGTSLAVHLVSFKGRETGNKFELTWQAESEQAGDIYAVEKRAGLSGPFTEVYEVTAASDRSSNNYSINVPVTSGLSYYRLRVISKDGQISYSQIITADGNNRQMLRTYITGTNLMCKLPSGTTSVELFDALGKLLVKKKTDPAVAQVNISLTNIAKGIITVRALINDDWQVARVLY